MSLSQKPDDDCIPANAMLLRLGYSCRVQIRVQVSKLVYFVQNLHNFGPKRSVSVITMSECPRSDTGICGENEESKQQRVNVLSCFDMVSQEYCIILQKSNQQPFSTLCKLSAS